MNNIFDQALKSYVDSLNRKAQSGQLPLEKYKVHMEKLQEWVNHYDSQQPNFFATTEQDGTTTTV